MSLVLTRRRFLQLATAAATSNLVSPALTAPRLPYVGIGESVSFIGLALHPEPTFTGGAIVARVHDWDGVGYPCDIYSQGFYNPPRLMKHTFYDADLCNFLRELPPNFWHDRSRVGKYPNVHSYVREQRYGEPVSMMLERMAKVGITV